MESVTFQSIRPRLSLHIKSEGRAIDSLGQVVMIPAKIISFPSGQYVTSDVEEIELIRKSLAYAKSEVFEVSESDKKLFSKQVQGVESKVVRGAISTQDLHGEMGIKEEPQKGLKIGVTHCDICNATFEQDFAGRRIRMHKIKHRRSQEK